MHKPIFYSIPNERGDNVIIVCLKHFDGMITRGLAICSPEESEVDVLVGMQIAEGRANWAYGVAVREIVERFGLHLSDVAKVQLKRFGDRHGNEIIRDEAKLIAFEAKCPFTKKAYSAPHFTDAEVEMMEMAW